MKQFSFTQLLGISLCVLSLFSGCETLESLDNVPKFKTPDGNYDKILEEQKAGLPQHEPLAELPAMSIDEHERLGDAHLQQGRWAMAVAQYDEVLREDPSRTATRYKVGMLLLKNRKIKQSLKHFDMILKEDSKFALAYEGKGEALLMQGDLFGADQAFRKALNLNPKLWRAHNYLGILADRRHLHLSAIEAYKAALAIQPREGAVLNNLGMAYYMNRRYRQAVKSFHMAMQSGLDSPKIPNNLGLALAKLGQYPQAFDAFRKGTDPARAYNNIGIAFLEAGKPHQAIACFEKAIDLQPTFYEKANENLRQAKRAAGKRGAVPSTKENSCLGVKG